MIQSPRHTSSLLFKGTGVKTFPERSCVSNFWRRAKNVHWMFLLFLISRSRADTVSQTVSLLHKAVKDFFNHVPFVF